MGSAPILECGDLSPLSAPKQSADESAHSILGRHCRMGRETFLPERGRPRPITQLCGGPERDNPDVSGLRRLNAEDHRFP